MDAGVLLQPWSRAQLQCEEQSLGSCSNQISAAVTNIKTVGNWGGNGCLKTYWHFVVSGKSRPELKWLCHTHRPEVKQNKHTIPACLLSAIFLLHCYDPLEWDVATHNLPGLPTSIKIKTKRVYPSSLTEPEQVVVINLDYIGIMEQQVMKREGMNWKRGFETKVIWESLEGRKGRGKWRNYIAQKVEIKHHMHESRIRATFPPPSRFPMKLRVDQIYNRPICNGSNRNHYWI